MVWAGKDDGRRRLWHASLSTPSRNTCSSMSFPVVERVAFSEEEKAAWEEIWNDIRSYSRRCQKIMFICLPCLPRAVWLRYYGFYLTSLVYIRERCLIYGGRRKGSKQQVKQLNLHLDLPPLRPIRVTHASLLFKKLSNVTRHLCRSAYVYNAVSISWSQILKWFQA